MNDENPSRAAVEAVAVALYEHRYETRDWEEAKAPEFWRAAAKAAIEAAAPIVQAQAWSKGYAAGELDGAYGLNGHEEPDQRNPYRKADK